MINTEEKNALAAYRLQRAYETLNEAKCNVEMKLWHATANRLYYACFYAVLGLLIKNGHSSRTHKGVFMLFGLYFVTPGIISHEQNKLFRKLFDFRQGGDYDDWFYINEEDILPLIEPVEEFIKTIENLIYKRDHPFQFSIVHLFGKLFFITFVNGIGAGH
jgi:uncharacterized protein (UPF0332 family)